MLINKKAKYESDGADITAVFAALGDPTRRAIIERLAKGEATVAELSEPFAISAPAISRHLKVLEQAGREAQSRPCRLEVAPFRKLHDWTTEMGRFWGESFDRMDAYLAEMLEQKERNQ